MKPKSKSIDFILASASPRRRHLLRQAGYKFRIIPSRVSERVPRGMTPASLVQFLALKKALSVAKKNPSHIVVGADTLVFVKNKVIGKPRNKSHAKLILKTLSGAWQKVYTGVSVVSHGGRWKKCGVRLSHVKFKKLTEMEIEAASHRNLDKAGAYSIQHKRDRFVEFLRGDYDNVVGLPLKVVKKLLHSARQTLSKAF